MVMEKQRREVVVRGAEEKVREVRDNNNVKVLHKEPELIMHPSGNFPSAGLTYIT